MLPESMNGKGVSVGGQQSAWHDIHGREMASATNSVHRVGPLTINLSYISDCVCTHAGTHARVCPFQNGYRCVIPHMLLFECVSQGLCECVCARNWTCVCMCICVYIFITCAFASQVCISVTQCVCGHLRCMSLWVCDCSTICLSWFSVDAIQGAQLL